MTREKLDDIARRTGTDKSSEINDYCTFYDGLFGDQRDLPINILEIGVFQGNSIAMWEEAFPKATITGLDNDLSNLRRKPERATLYEVDAADPKQMHDVGEALGPFDIVIEDSAHRVDVSQNVVDQLWEDYIAPEGWLVIEDTAAHWMHYPKHNLFTQWAMDLVRDGTHLDAQMKTTKRDTWDNPTPFQKLLDYAVVRPGIVALKKMP